MWGFGSAEALMLAASANKVAGAVRDVAGVEIRLRQTVVT